MTEMQVLKSIDELMSTYKLSDIEELIIEDMRLESITPSMQEKIEKLVHLESLSFLKCGLRSLDNLPKLPNLLRISLDHNSITGTEIGKLGNY